MSYIFLLGRKEKLSLAELRTRLGNIELIDGKAAFHEGDLPAPPQKFLDSLGGTIKICELAGEINNANQVQDFIAEFLAKHFADATSKVNFGTSLYNLTGRHEISLKNLLKNSKRFLAENGIKSRFVNKMFKNVANTAIHDSGLLRHGIELCIFSSADRILIGKTTAVQDFKLYGFRDYSRPARNQKSGMLPPKLAQIMINLSGAQPGSTLWDPFCGSGTILMEGLLMGMNVVGSDISEKAVERSRENMRWLERHFKFKGKWEVFARDAAGPGKTAEADTIVAETYLGPPLKFPPEEEKARKILEEVSGIIFEFLKNVKFEGPIVLAVPFIRERPQNFHIREFIEKAEKLGYSVFDLDNRQKSLLYDRPNQIIGREIFKLVRKSNRETRPAAN